MYVCGAREIQDRDVIFAGIGQPMPATWLARLTHAPNAVVVHENGIVTTTPCPKQMSGVTINIQDGFWLTSAIAVSNVAAHGWCNKGIIGAGQVDRYGNVNSTAVGDYHNPVHRWPGSGGGNDVSSFCPNVIIILEQSRRRFVEKVDFNTSPGYFNGKPGERQEYGLPAITGPGSCVTNMGTYIFVDGEMVLKTYHGDLGITIDDIRAATGWDLKVAADVKITEPPSEDYLRMLREQVGMPPV
jgi:acyl CoA:acetate/3-ketoacid CoA transferase beta subunit